MLYIYAISDEAPARPGRGLAREPLQCVDGSGIWVLAGEAASVLPVTPESLAAHDAVVRRLAARCPALLPARFGWLAGDAAEICAALAPHRAELKESLGLVRGCVQMTVRVFGTTPLLAPAPTVPATGPNPGTRYLLERAEALRAAESLPELEPMRVHLAELLRATREERQGTGDLVGTAYHLVERSRVRLYRDRARRSTPALRPLRVRITGPWAPYAFGPRVLS